MRLAGIDRDWQEQTETGRNRQRLAGTDGDWQEQNEIGKNRRRLARKYRDRQRMDGDLDSEDSGAESDRTWMGKDLDFIFNSAC